MNAQNISILGTLLLLFAAAISGGIIAKKFRLPTLTGYIAAGLIIGNLLPNIIENNILSLIADTGVTLLLFTLGLEFSLEKFRKVFRKITIAVIAQILIVTLLLFIICLAIGLNPLVSMIFAASGSLSSTAIVVRLLGEKGDLSSIPGELASGWLIIQDLAVVPIMLILPVISKIYLVGNSNIGLLIGGISVSLVKAGIALILIMVLGRYLIPKMIESIVKTADHEIYGLMILAIVLTTAVVTFALDLSAALGAFLAGIIIAGTSQNHAIFAEIKPLRNVFAVVFFVSLGLSIPIAAIIKLLPTILILTISLMVIKILVIGFLTRYLEYHRKTAFLVAIYLSQISEFGFIIGVAATGWGAISQEQMIMLNSWIFLTILINTFLIKNPHRLYYTVSGSLGKLLPKFFPSEATGFGVKELSFRDHIVICGYGRVGKYIGRALEMSEIPYIVIDYNSEVIDKLTKMGIPAIYGDPAEKDVLDYAQVDYCRVLVVAIPDKHTQQMIITNAQSLNRRIRIIARSHHEEDQKYLKTLGVQTVIQPEFAAALSISERLLTDFGLDESDIRGKISRLKIEHGLG